MNDRDSINLQETVYEPRAPKATPTLTPGDVFNNRYEVVRELGQGGMGVAYLVNDQLSKEELVLKVIHPTLVDDKARDRMIAEGVMTRKIRNPKVVSVYDVNEADGQIYLVMEYVQGEPLRNWMQSNMVQNVNAPLQQVVRIILEILAGLTAAHETGVVHRDLKPENIMINGDPGSSDFKLRILDFGIATGIKTEVFTSSVASIGTPLYMAPEQMTAPNAVRESADIYSIGRIFYEMLMDVLPDGTWHPPSEVRSDIPPALDKVIHKALQPPKFRYQNAPEFSAAILEATSSQDEIDELSKMVWTTAGAEEMLSKLNDINADLYQRLLGRDPFRPKPKNNVNDNDKFRHNNNRNNNTEDKFNGRNNHDDFKGPEVVEGDQSKKTDIKKYLSYGILGLFGAGAVAVFLEEEPLPPANDQPVIDNPIIQPPNPVPSPAAFNESWRLDEGGVVNVVVSGGRITGSGVIAPMGMVEIQGDPTTGKLMVYANGSYVADIVGTLAPGQNGNDFSGQVWMSGQPVRPIRFHINH